MGYPVGLPSGRKSLPDNLGAQVAIVDYGMGNLFSVKQACEYVGLMPVITSSQQEVEQSEAVILPGVGAFGDAMDTLDRLDLVEVLRDVADSPKPLLGICLGMQLLMSESNEFGKRSGMRIIEGEVTRLQTSVEGPRQIKVPQVGWNRICIPGQGPDQTDTEDAIVPDAIVPEWKSPLFNGLPNREYMYFVHSFYAQPTDADVIVSTTQYGPTKFCSSLRRNNVYGCQFHPERSGPRGLHIYRNLAQLVTTATANPR
jgi:glutamine amidotransferase